MSRCPRVSLQSENCRKFHLKFGDNRSHRKPHSGDCVSWMMKSMGNASETIVSPINTPQTSTLISSPKGFCGVHTALIPASASYRQWQQISAGGLCRTAENTDQSNSACSSIMTSVLNLRSPLLEDYRVVVPFVGEIWTRCQKAVTCISRDSSASVCIMYLIDIVFAVTARGAHLPISEPVYYLQVVNHFSFRWCFLCIKTSSVFFFFLPLEHERFVSKDVENNNK